MPSRTETPDPRDAARRPAGKAYRPGLDGLRALAVIGVLLYHAGVRWMPGGLLGVDLFFVISGFLITSLLIAELQRSGRIALAGFYGRRARRLFPALAAVLALAVGAMALFRPGDLVRFRGDLLASVGYVANWWFIVKHQSYFVASGRPSPFQHLWSLAVEEQFYILWPLGLLALWRSLTRGRGLTEARALARVGWYAAGAACLSASWMAYIALREDLPYGADSSRVYFGTDTHASGLLLGVAAAAFLATLSGPLWQRRPGRAARWMFDLAGVAALVGVSWAMLRASEFSPGLYRGGILAFGVAAAVAVTAVSRPGGFLAGVFASLPGRWIGTRSYALYLWHWPVFVYTRPQLDVPLTGTANVVLRLAVTAILAEASYRLVERPIRNLRWRDSWLRRRGPGVSPATARSGARSTDTARVNGTWRRVAATLTMVAGVALGSAGVLSLGYAVYQIGGQPAHGKSLTVTSSSLHSTPDAHTAVSRLAPASSSPITATVSPTVTPPAPSASPPASPTPALLPLPDGHNVTAIGDSVMLGAVAGLTEALPGATVNAVEGRQASSAFSLIDGLVNSGQLGADVVLHTGTNGTIDPQALDSLLTRVADRRVTILNLHVPRPWQDLNNATLAAAARAHPNVALLDWNTAASAHPEWLWDDGIHLRPAGAAAYRDLILDALRHEG